MYNFAIVKIQNIEPLKIGVNGVQSIYAESTANHIPGSTIRGALIGELIRLNLFNDDTKNDFLLEMECYNAYPFDDNVLYLPKPLHLRIDKHEWRSEKGKNQNQVRLYDLFEKEEGLDGKKNNFDYSFVGYKGSMKNKKEDIKNEVLLGKNVEKEYRLHHSTSKNQNVKDNFGEGVNNRERENLFRYEAISPGQTFVGVIKYNVKLEKDINELFNHTKILYFGGSKSSGYGRSKINFQDIFIKSYSEVKVKLGIQSTKEGKQNKIRITCLADCLFRDKFGQPINHIPEEYISNLINKDVKLEDLFVRHGKTEGFNSKWNARYPKETTVKAGSIFEYKFLEDVTLDELNKLANLLESSPIGGRTQDGYGWIACNIYYPTKIQIKESIECGYNKSRNTKKPVELDEILKDAKMRNTFEILIRGMRESKKRWLNMVYVKSSLGTNENKKIIISDELNNSQLKNMEDLIQRWIDSDKEEGILKLAEKEETIMGRYYVNDNKLLGIIDRNFKEILEYLNTNNSEVLKEFANNKLNSLKGRIFYSEFDKDQIHRQFIAELLMAGLYIERMKGE